MHIIAADNAAVALREGVHLLMTQGVREETRAGPCLVAPAPVVTITRHPMQRVLFSKIRDANPVFHLIESLWMLAGRNDVVSLTRYVKSFDGYADDGVVHGAYGHRWRHALGFDQLDAVVDKLSKDPGSRQAVIQMWDATPSDYVLNPTSKEKEIYGSDDLRGTWKDRPCNTHVYLRIRDQTIGDSNIKVLDLIVCCRSNDAILGAHGANAVHFSVLQEYLATRIGVGVGRMYQMSNNYHAYVSEINRLTGRMGGVDVSLAVALDDDRYSNGTVSPTVMFNHHEDIDNDLKMFFEWHGGSMGMNGVTPAYSNVWFERVAQRAALAHWHFIHGNTQLSLDNAARIEAADWSMATIEWIKRRIK
jgi:thymidylate synthase